MAAMAARVRELFQFRGLDVLQKFHPLVVHYPIALLTLAPLLYLGAWMFGRETLAWTALWVLALGTAGAAVAVGRDCGPALA